MNQIKVFLTLILISSFYSGNCKLSCIDNNGKNVAWIVANVFPGSIDDLMEGMEDKSNGVDNDFAYTDSNSNSQYYDLIMKPIDDSDTWLSRTFAKANNAYAT